MKKKKNEKKKQNPAKYKPRLGTFPFGAERFTIILAVPLGFIRHIIPFTFAFFGLCSGGNGPATIPCCTHSASASVTCAPASMALGALPLKVGSLALPLQPMSAPFSKSRHTRSRRVRSSQPTALAHERSRTGFIGDTPTRAVFSGNFSQNCGLCSLR